MDNQPLVLIVSRSAQLRNSLSVLIQSSARVQSIRHLADLRSAGRLEDGGTPALVILAFGPDETDIPSTLDEVKDRWPHTPVIVLVDNERQFPNRDHSGAEVVLVKGVLAANLIKVAERLMKRT